VALRERAAQVAAVELIAHLNLAARVAEVIPIKVETEALLLWVLAVAAALHLLELMQVQ
jgi:hypothetical protein